MKRNIKLLGFLFLSLTLFNACKEEDPEEPCKTPETPVASNSGSAGVGSVVTLTASEVSGATYLWKGPNNFTSTERIASVTVQDKAVGEYSVIAVVGECEGPASYTYVEKCASATPSSNSPVAELTTLSLSASFVEGATYSWTGPVSLTYPDGFTSNLQNPTIPNASKSAEGAYTVTVTKGSCVGEPKTTNVIIKPAKVTITSSPASTVVAGVQTVNITVGNNLTLTANSPSADVSYIWYVPQLVDAVGDTIQNKVVSFTGITRKHIGTYRVVAVLNGVVSDTTKINVNVNFQTVGCQGVTTVTHDVKTYTAVQIGNQCWLTENIKETGSLTVDLLVGNWEDASAGFGTAPLQGACPTGWHLGTDAEWTTLSQSATVVNNSNNLKGIGQGNGAGAGTNASGFNAKVIGTGVNFWTSTTSALDASMAYYRRIEPSNTIILRDVTPKVAPDPTNPTFKGYVRCIKD